MSKPPLKSDDPLVMKLRILLKKTEPRKFPTQTVKNDYGHTGWLCPYCKEYVHGSYRTRYPRHGAPVTEPDYSQYNMHFSAVHGTKFWKEKQIIKLFEKEGFTR